MQYEYDSTGDLSSMVLLTFMLVLLVPLTYRSIWPKRTKVLAAKDFPLNVQDDELVNTIAVNKSKKSSIGALYKSYFSFKNVFLGVGWVVVAYLTLKIIQTPRESKYWNPYEILGISESATEKEIKKHYKRLSVKFHPDKVRLAANQTLEDVQEQFVGLTKAYKALTDEEIRQNFLEYGHPDGKQDLAVGIALPSWMVEGGQSLWVLAAYCVTLLIALPVLVGRWWYRSAKVTKDGLLNETAERYFKNVEDDMTVDGIISLLVSAAEFDDLASRTNAMEELTSIVQESCGISQTTRLSPAEALLRAHMCRIPLKDVTHIAAQQYVLGKVQDLHRGLHNIVLSYGYLRTQLKVMELSAAIIQAILPGQSTLLQLPYVRHDHVKLTRAIKMEDVLHMEDNARKDLLGLSGNEYKMALGVAKALPVLDAAYVGYQVEGDNKITGNAIVQLVFKLRKAGGSPLKPADLLEDEADEGNVEAILGADEKLAATAVPDTLCWAPYFPSTLKNHFWLSMSDIKQDRVIVGPISVEDIGDQLRTFKIPFQAPPTAGLYTFQAHIMSDAYLGLDKLIPLELDVVEELEVGGKDDDEISEPDEDTIAGQMAAMKGKPVHRTAAHEYDSSSEEELTDDSSDDDSDSD